MVQLISALIVGGLLWQLATFAVFILVNQDEHTTVLYSMGIFTGIICLWDTLNKRCRLVRDKRKYNCYWLYTNNNPITHAYMTKEYAKQFETNSEANNYILLTQYGCEFNEPIDQAYLLDNHHVPIGTTLEDISKFYKK